MAGLQSLVCLLVMLCIQVRQGAPDHAIVARGAGEEPGRMHDYPTRKKKQAEWYPKMMPAYCTYEPNVIRWELSEEYNGCLDKCVANESECVAFIWQEHCPHWCGLLRRTCRPVLVPEGTNLTYLAPPYYRWGTRDWKRYWGGCKSHTELHPYHSNMTLKTCTAVCDNDDFCAALTYSAVTNICYKFMHCDKSEVRNLDNDIGTYTYIAE